MLCDRQRVCDRGGFACPKRLVLFERAYLDMRERIGVVPNPDYILARPWNDGVSKIYDYVIGEIYSCLHSDSGGLYRDYHIL